MTASTRLITQGTTGRTYALTLDRTDPNSIPVTTAHGHRVGTIVPARDGTWLALPSTDNATGWGVSTEREALVYLLDTADLQDPEDANYQAIRDSLNHQDWDGQRREHTVVLAPGERSWNPASTKEDSQLTGPATVTYVEYRDGSVHAQAS